VPDTRSTPASFTTESFYGNNAFLFVDAAGQKQAGRYQIIPAAGVQYLNATAAKAKSPNFLIDDLKTRLAATLSMTVRWFGQGPVSARNLTTRKSIISRRTR
jgi:catalase